MLFTIICVNSALGILVIYNSIFIDINLNRDKSLFKSSYLTFALSTTLLGFVLEFIILTALLFVLYTGWLFIALTRDEKNEDFQQAEDIEISSKTSEIDEKKLKFKTKVYCTFIVSGIVLFLSNLTLAIGFVFTVIPEGI